MRLLLSSAVLLAATSLTACSSDDGAAPAPAAVTETVTATVTATPEPATAEEPAALGEEQVGDDVTVTALDIDPQTTVDSAIQDQQRWASVLVRTCANEGANAAEPLTVSWLAWQVAEADGSTYNVTGYTGGIAYPLPTYPQDPGQRLADGQCIKGWVTLNVAPGAKLTQVIYGNGGGTPIVWNI